jgi:hypothetical protein
MLGYIAIDQYGQTYKLKTNHPRKELLELFGRATAAKMYIDTKGGETKHTGYVISGHWLSVYQIHEFKKVQS